jgi:8-oxo-dGTP pyrophosphatase MutT (NUDIX family)
MEKILQIGVKILLLNSDKNKYLGIKRNQSKALDHPESIDIPGGRIEFNEEPIDGLKRELMEEIGYSLKYEPVILDASNIVNNSERQIVRITYFSHEDIDMSDITIGNEHESAMFIPLLDDNEIHPLLRKSICKYKSIFNANR